MACAPSNRGRQGGIRAINTLPGSVQPRPFKALPPIVRLPLAVTDLCSEDGPEMVAAMLSAFPNSVELSFKRAGHSPFAKDVERFNHELVAFVDLHRKRMDAP